MIHGSDRPAPEFGAAPLDDTSTAPALAFGLESVGGRHAAVVVTIRKRRQLGGPAGGATSSAGGETLPANAGMQDRKPRVFVLGASAKPAPEAVSLAGLAEHTAEQADEQPAGDERPVQRRRRRLAPSRAPGEVRRIVFAESVPLPQPPPQAQAAEKPPAVGPAEGASYAQVVAGLDALRDTLAQARAARRLRFV